MSKPAEKKTGNLNGTPPGTINGTATNFSSVAPLESSHVKEAAVCISVKEVRYGGKTLPNSEVVAVINGLKRSWAVPMNEPYRQEFAKVDDEMVFKFAVTSNHDLLGFLYIEMPKKFRLMKTLKLEDWFPIKRLETEDREKEMFQNYQAKIVIDYEAFRKLDIIKPMTNRAPKAELFQELTASLREKLDALHKRIDDYSNEGFRYLDQYQNKLAQNKTNATMAETGLKKAVRVAAAPNKTVEAQKETFYRTRALGETDDKAGMYNTAPAHDKTVQIGKFRNDKEEECPRCEKLFKELSYSNQELVTATNRASALEKAKMTPENLNLKREVEILQQHLSKDRRDLNIKLKEANNNLQAETVKLNKRYEQENEAAKELQAEARALQQELADRLKAVENREKEVAKKKESLSKREVNVNDRQRKIKSEFEQVLREQQELTGEMRDMEELKRRMMIERERVFAEQAKLHHTKSGNEEKTGHIQTVEEFLEEEKEQFKKELAKRNLELDQLRAEVDKQKRLQELEAHTLADNKTDFERRLREHNEAVAHHKIEVARMARERNNMAGSMNEFLEQKKGFEQEKDMADEEIAHNYDLLDEQTQQLAEQRAEYNRLLKKMTEFEEQLGEQSRAHQEQKNKFVGIQKQFFRKIREPNPDFKELKKLAEEVGVNLNSADEKFKEAQNIEREMNRVRTESRQSIDRISNPGSRDDGKGDRKSMDKTGGPRKTARMKDTMSFIGGGQVDNKMKLAQNAAELVEKIFSDASLVVYKKHNVNKQEIIDALRFKIETLQLEIRKLTEKAQGAKINFLADNVEEEAIAKGVTSSKDGGLLKGASEDDREPNEVMENMIDLCEGTYHQIEQDLEAGADVPHAKEKMEHLSLARRVVTEQFKVLRQLAVAAGKEAPAKGEKFDWANGQLDHERIRAQFEAKMKTLIDYIRDLKINNDFFNPAIDTAILTN